MSTSDDVLTLYDYAEIVNIDMITPSTTVNRQSTILLYCVAYGFPAAPSITWQFSGNGTSIIYDPDQVSVSSASSLSVNYIISIGQYM